MSINWNMSKSVDKKTPCQNSILDTLKKATTRNSDWPDKVNIIGWEYYLNCFFLLYIILMFIIKWFIKDEFLDVIYWARQILGLIAGLLWGLLPLKGLFGLGL